MNKKQSYYIQLDLIIILFAFIGISIISIYNAQQLEQYHDNFAVKQMVYYGIGVIFLVLLQFIDLEQLYKSSLYLYIFGVLLLIALYFSPHSIARPVNNAKKWFNEIPFMTVQPSEIMKIVFILFAAALIVRHKEKFANKTLRNDIRLLVKLVFITIIPVFFIIQEPDLGVSLIFFFIMSVFIILSEINWKILLTLILTGLSSFGLTIFLVVRYPEFTTRFLGIKPYQIDRIMTWFNPTQQVNDERYQIDLSLRTIGSGQLKGKGMDKSESTLPEAHTDFIFSIVGESFGFIGSTAVLFLFFLFIYKLVILGMKSLEFSPYGAYICFGFIALLTIHTFQNIGMTIGIMPITGVPLLFISYGGSTILSTMLIFGVIYRIAVEHSRQQDFLF